MPVPRPTAAGSVLARALAPLLAVAVVAAVALPGAPGPQGAPSGVVRLDDAAPVHGLLDFTPPPVPSGVSAAGHDRSLAVSWSAVVDPDPVTYHVYLDGVLARSVAAPATSTTLTGLVNGRSYGVAVSASDVHPNESARSAAVLAAPVDDVAPPVPTGLAAARGDARVHLTWTPATDADTARVRVLQDGVRVAELAGTAGSHTATGLVNDREHAFALVAVDAAGNASTASPAVRATPTDLTAPAAPAEVSAQAGDARAVVRWRAVPDLDVVRYSVLREDGAVAAGVDAPATSATVTGLTNGSTYRLRVVAVDGHGNTSAASAAVEVTPVDTTPPGTPTGVGAAATAGDRSLTVTWTAVTDPDLVGYRVLLDGAVAAQVGAGTTSTALTGLENGREYAVTVVALDGAGNASAPSAPVRATPVDTTAPAVPEVLGASGGDGSLSLSWGAVPDADLAGYDVLLDGAVVRTAPAGTTSATLAGLVNGTTYAVAVRATDATGNTSAASAAVRVTPADRTPPSAPTGVTAQAGDASAVVRWSAVPEGDVAGYRVLVDDAVAVTVPAGQLTATLTGLVNGRAHAVAVVAVDAAGNASAPSGAVAATPADATAPAVPDGVTATAGDGSARVEWTAVADADLAAYRVLLDGATAATVPAGTTSASLTGLVNGTAHAVSVVAVDSSGNASAASAAVSVTPTAPPPPAPSPPPAPPSPPPAPPSPPSPPPSPSVPAQGAGGLSGLAATRDGRWVVLGTRAALEAGDTNGQYELHVLDRRAGTARRIAALPAGATASDSTNTSAVALSEDGRYLALASRAALVASDTNGQLDAYRLDLASGAWQLVSVPASGAVSASAGTVLQTGSSIFATGPSVAISADGDRVLFYSARADLVPGDTNGAVDLFAKDVGTGAVRRVSSSAAGGELGRAAAGPALALTPDGRYALFPASRPNGPATLLRKDLLTGEVLPVSTGRTAAGAVVEVAVSRDAGDVAVSDDGRYVLYSTAAKVTTTSPGALGAAALAHRQDVATGAVVALGSGQTTAWEHQLALDPTGRYAFFSTSAAALPADANGRTDHYRRDLATGGLVLVTARADGSPAPGAGGATTPAEYGALVALSADVVLVTTLQPLVAEDANGARDVYRKDLLSGAVGSLVP
ncbi:fibronectin type III domain-containing protein [Quadrisphaera sp. DSM 44207]|uniref:fibronectin type III domain-containing protein n=1 Tax=Quadrisphaera sp. DSM 44207 TaxID=1881057 RepID=UPI00088A691C|nr:fibronectin type III domain-containing protein [Quadrisphaera sp. DSM 44207]SDQ05597.1 fibronectin type 3 domain-containing protein [Quadrisphaera sp. DSM 44207]